MLQVLREGEVAHRQRRGASRVERRAFLGQQPRIRQEERGAIDPVPSELALVVEARRHELERNSELQELGLVALQLALGRVARTSVVFREGLAQLRERHGLARVEQQRDHVEEPLGAVHLPQGETALLGAAFASSSTAHWIAATLSLGISTFLPASGPSRVPTTQ